VWFAETARGVGEKLLRKHGEEGSAWTEEEETKQKHVAAGLELEAQKVHMGLKRRWKGGERKTKAAMSTLDGK